MMAFGLLNEWNALLLCQFKKSMRLSKDLFLEKYKDLAINITSFSLVLKSCPLFLDRDELFHMVPLSDYNKKIIKWQLIVRIVIEKRSKMFCFLK